MRAEGALELFSMGNWEQGQALFLCGTLKFTPVASLLDLAAHFQAVAPARAR